MADNKARNTMYYKKKTDRELMRDADETTEDSADPMETDGYGPDQGIGGWDGEKNFSVPTKADQTDGLKLTKLRKKGMPGGK